MHTVTAGLICALLYVVMESAQFVYFGKLFQQLSPFLFGALVFGLIVLVFAGRTIIVAPQEFKRALALPRLLLAINLGAVVTFTCYLLSVRLLEPAITYTVSAGTMPLTAWVLFKTGMREQGKLRNRAEATGILIIFASIVFLAVITLGGLSGFVRGGWTAAAIGLLLTIADGVFFTLILVYSQRLSEAGIGAAAILGLRLPLYVLVTGALAAGTTQVLPPLAPLTLAVLVGFLLIVPPLYLLQRAAAILSTLTLSAITTLGPLVILLLQWLEGRVAYSTATTIGLTLYMVGAATAAFGSVNAETKTVATD